MGDETEVLEPVAGTEDAETEGAETEQIEGDEPETDADEAGEEGDEGSTDEVTVTIGDEQPAETEDEERAPTWVRELRKSNREKDRRIRELEQAVQTARPAVQAAAAVGAKPKLEDCEYDTARFETELEAWHERKRVADAEEGKKRDAAQKAQADWDARLANHGKLKGELKVKDFEDAEAAVEAAMTVTQRGLIVHGAENSAVLFYALGKNPQKLKDLASITDPVKFAFAVAKLETQLKVTPRKAPPVPERDIRGSGSIAGDEKLNRLRAEADRTGDRTKVAAHIRAKQLAARK